MTIATRNVATTAQLGLWRPGAHTAATLRELHNAADDFRGMPSTSQPNADRPQEPMIALSPDEVHVWLSYYDPHGDVPLQSDCRTVLSEAEREQEARLGVHQERLQYLFSRALLRRVLSRYAPLRPMDWRFSRNRHGRPEIANPQPPEQGIQFNLSHTHGLIVLGISRCPGLGVDAENLDHRHSSMALARRFFAPDEITALAALDEDLRHERFFEYWTLKEAYIKARGMGLALPLDSFGFSYPQAGRVALVVDSALMDDSMQWRFWLIAPARHYRVAICARQPVPLLFNPCVRELDLGGAERIVNPGILRMTDSSNT